MTQTNIYVLKGGALNQVKLKSEVNSSIELNFNQSANVNLKPRKRCMFCIYVMLFQSSDTFHKEFDPS
jgi:hypothetical protein